MVKKIKPKKHDHAMLPTELVINILTKLPVKSLGKFKSVSKQWLHSITKDPYFISTHRELCLRNPNILLLLGKSFDSLTCLSRFDFCSFNFDGSSVKNKATFSLYLENVDDDIVMLPSKWDIVCLVCDNSFFACNPSKQTVWAMPEASYGYCDEVNVVMGYVKETDEYVFVRLFNRKCNAHIGGHDAGCEVLRLSDGKDCEWEVINVDCPFAIKDLGCQPGVYVENVAYWYICQGDLGKIWFFDLSMEEFGSCLPPESRGFIKGLGREWLLVELGGSLCVVDYIDKSGHTMDIWVMEDYVERSWVLVYNIDMNAYGTDACVVPLDIRNGIIWMDVDQRSIDYYDVEKKCIKRMDQLIEGKSTWLRLYTESFFSYGSR